MRNAHFTQLLRILFLHQDESNSIAVKQNRTFLENVIILDELLYFSMTLTDRARERDLPQSENDATGNQLLEQMGMIE